MKRKKEGIKNKYIRVDMAISNCRYGALYLIITAFSSLILLLVLIAGKLKESPYIYHYIGAYLLAVIFPLILIVFGLTIKKKIQKHVRLIMALSNIIIIISCLWSAYLAVVSVFEESKDIFNVISFMLYIIILPMVLYSPVWYYVLGYIIHFGIILLFDLYNPNIEVTLWTYINMVVFYIFGVLVVYIRNKAKCETVTTQFISREEIENQKQQNIRMSKLVDELRIVSITDRLTGLYNRVFLDESANQIWEESMQAKENVVVVMIDIDDFKAINDTFGHVAGDACLRRISDLIREYAISNNGLSFRYGGEEFIIIYKGYSLESVKSFMIDLRQSAEQIVLPKYPDIALNISLGMAGTIPNEKNNFYEIVSEADKKLYEEKRKKGHGIKKYKR